MKCISIFTLIVTLSVISPVAIAQLTENQGWVFVSHKQALSEKFDLLADVQTRSANQFNYLATVLLRGALSYNFSKKHSAALGYAYKGDWEKKDQTKMYSHENRIYEQYIYNFKLKRIELILRGRFEQRWVKDDKLNFSQRGRVFISAQIPLTADSTFTKGYFLGLQNEVFLNVQHRERVNNSIFDQNRTFGSIGYRLSKSIDVELGYMYWFQREMATDYRRNVIQIMLTTHL